MILVRSSTSQFTPAFQNRVSQAHCWLFTPAPSRAVQEMVDYLRSSRGLSRTDAYRLASIAADLRITQLVDGNVGVHMMVPKSIFKR